MPMPTLVASRTWGSALSLAPKALQRDASLVRKVVRMRFQGLQGLQPNAAWRSMDL